MSSNEDIMSKSANESAVPLINESECQTNDENYAKDNNNSTNYESNETKVNKYSSDSLLSVSAPPRRKFNRSGSVRRSLEADTKDKPLIESNQISTVESCAQTNSECLKASNNSIVVVTNKFSNDSKQLSTFDSSTDPYLKDSSTQCLPSDLINADSERSCRRSNVGTNNGLKHFPLQPMDRIRRWKTQWFTSDEAKANRRRRLNRCIYYLKVFLTHLFSTTGLCLLVIAYTCLGAFIFTFLESKNEINKRNFVQIERIECARDLWNQTLNLNVFYPGEWNRTVILRLLQFEEAIVKAVREGNYGNTSDQWTFSGALLYSVTVITTIGYGNVTCKTSWGRIVTMIYALFGIPVMFLCLANLGNLMAQTFRFSYKRICCVCFCCCDRLSNKYNNNKNPNNRLQQKSQNERIELKNCSENEKEIKVIFSENDEQKVRSIIALTPSTPPTASDSSSQASSPLKTELSQQNSELLAVHENRLKVGVKVDTNNDRVPIWLVILLVIGYILGGASMFSFWENDWSFLMGAYFCFTTLTTIGFGDLVPGSAKYSDNEEEQTKFIICCAYLIVGLSLLAMSFNLVQEEIVIKSKELGRRIGIIPQQSDNSIEV